MNNKKPSTPTRNASYKVGDWLFCEFKLQQVTRVEGSQITEVSDGNFCHSSNGLNAQCFPLEMKVKLISDSFKYWSAKLHKEGNRSLNYPDIHCWLVDKWANTCEHRGDDVYVEKSISELNRWAGEILQRCNELKYVVLEGVKIFS